MEDQKALFVVDSAAKLIYELAVLKRATCYCLCYSSSHLSHNWPSSLSWLRRSLNTSLNLFSSLAQQKMFCFLCWLGFLPDQSVGGRLQWVLVPVAKKQQVSGCEPLDGLGSVNTSCPWFLICFKIPMVIRVKNSAHSSKWEQYVW